MSKVRKPSSLTDDEAFELAHHPSILAAEILAEAIIELSKAVRAATHGDELLGLKSPVIEAAKIVSAEIREVLETLFEERGVG
jgi:hypothetical protein